MQMDDAMRLRREWAAKGNAPCDHPATDKEYDRGSDTGDRVCTTCGQTFVNGKLV